MQVLKSYGPSNLQAIKPSDTSTGKVPKKSELYFSCLPKENEPYMEYCNIL